MTSDNKQSIPIKKGDSVVGKSGVKITSTNWDPNRGAAEQQARVEQAIKDQWKREQAINDADPIQQRLGKVEQQLAELIESYKHLAKRVTEND